MGACHSKRAGMAAMLALTAVFFATPAHAQDHLPLLDSAQTAPHRIHLILKDGSYQLVLGYTVRKDIVRYQSAERNGETEEIPLADVDLPATERWVREHTENADDTQRPVVLSPELAREEAERAAMTPEVAPNLRLPEEDSVLVLDVFEGTPELVPLPQQGSDLNPETAHETQKAALNPSASQHRIGDVPGERADVQLHIPDPAFFVREGEDAPDAFGGPALTVDTHGQSGRATPGGGSDRSTYVLERIGVHAGLRELDSFHIAQLGTGVPQRDIIELKHDDLPGGHWLKLTPVEPLLFGEYALVEILSGHEVNLDVWDFGVHADAKENVEAQRPEVRKPRVLQPRVP
jgi:hypothetical protein